MVGDMISLLKSLCWLRWHQSLHRIRLASRKGPFQTFSRVAGIVLPFLLLILMTPMVLGLSVLAWKGGYMLARGEAQKIPIFFLIRLFLWIPTIAILISPAVGGGDRLGTTFLRLKLLPIPIKTLRWVLVLGGIADPWVLGTLPIPFFLALGLITGGKVVIGLLAVVSGIGLGACLLGLSAVASFITQMIFRNRRLASWLTLAASLLLVLFSFLPMLINRGNPNFVHHQGTKAAFFDLLSLNFHGELFTRSLEGLLLGRIMGGLVSILLLTLLAWALFTGAWILLKKLEGPQSMNNGSASHKTAKPLMAPPPFLSPVTFAALVVQVRMVTRTMRGRLCMLMTFLAGPILALVLDKVPSHFMRRIPFSTGQLAAIGGFVMALLSLTIFTLNLFATDGQGLTLLRLSPLSNLQMIRGKCLGIGLLGLGAGFLGLLGALLLRPQGSPLMWSVPPLLFIGAFIPLSTIESILSGFFPKHVNLESMSNKAQPATVPSLLGLPCLALSLLIPLAGLLGPPLLGFHPIWGWLALIGWTSLMVALAPTLWALPARAIQGRWENLLQVARGE